MSYRGYCEFSELLGKTLASIEGAEANSGEITFTLSDGSIYRMLHEQDCCESVGVVDVIGDVADLIGLPLVLAEESTSGEDPEGYTDETERESFTWTFYRIASPKGHVDIRWLGESNGYYGEGVSFCRLRGPTP